MSPSRRLQDGWDYNPDWRLKTIEEYLSEIAAAKDRGDALQGILWREPDPFVRQGLRFRMHGRSVAQRAFEWAFRCARDNRKSGVLSMLKAMVIAGLPAKMIAMQLATEVLNIAVAEKLFFDVRRCLVNRLWLRNAVIQPWTERELTIEEARERHWLTVAFDSGWLGIEVVLQGGEDASDESRESRAKKIEAIAGQRALEYLRDLQHRAVAANEDDLKRYILARGMRSREAVTTASEQANKIKEWGLALVSVLGERNKKDLDAKTIQDAARLLPIVEMQELMVRQLEAKPIETDTSAECDSTNLVTAPP